MELSWLDESPERNALLESKTDEEANRATKRPHMYAGRGG